MWIGIVMARLTVKCGIKLELAFIQKLVKMK